MKIEHIKRGSLEYAIIRELYSADEVVKIKQEIVKLRKQAAVNSTRPALDPYGRSLNFADSLWVDELYPNRKESNILTINRKLFTENIAEKLARENQYFAHLRYCDMDFTLLNYYTNDTEYKAHRDRSMLTALTFFSIGDFTGGELEFVEFGEVIKPVQNTVVLFPGCIEHRAHPVTTDGDHSFRVSMAQFINYTR